MTTEDVRKADLHSHTVASDGVYTPEELLARAADAGLWALGVSDHDALGSIPQAREAGRKAGVEVFPGVELSTRYVPASGEHLDIHILGLLLDGGSEADLARLDAHLAERRAQRLGRGREMVERLRKAGVDITWEEVEGEAAGGSVGRPHVGRVLVRHGLAADLDDAFSRYLSPGRPAYVEQAPLSVAEAAQWIRGSGGAVIWAHPGLAGFDPATCPWTDLLDGVEVDHPKHDAATRASLRALAERWNLVPTGGSDCHGTKGREDVGVCTTPEPLVRELAARAAARRRR